MGRKSSESGPPARVQAAVTLVPVAAIAGSIAYRAPGAIDGSPPDLERALAELWGRLESPESRRGYQTDWRFFCAWLRSEGTDPRAADVSTIQRYVNHLRDTGKSKATRARALSVLREVYRALVTGKVCSSNPAREVKNPRVDSAPRTPWLDESGVRKLFASAGGATQEGSWADRRDRVAVLTSLFLGFRRSEVVRIRIEDFRGGESGWSIHHTVKRGKEKQVGCPPSLKREIDAWCAWAKITSGPILPHDEGSSEPMTGKMLYDAVRRLAKVAGVDATPHALRRTFITILRERGVDIRDLQLAVSHESVTTTERYEKASKAARQAPGEKLADLVYGTKSSAEAKSENT